MMGHIQYNVVKGIQEVLAQASMYTDKNVLDKSCYLVKLKYYLNLPLWEYIIASFKDLCTPKAGNQGNV